MKNLRILAIFIALGFVTYQLYNLNSQVRDENALSSLIEVYTVDSDGQLFLRKGPGTDQEIIMKLDGKDSGSAAEVILISKDSDDWWMVQFTDKDEKVFKGYVSSEYLKLIQFVETFSLFWNETNKAFEEEDSTTCERLDISFEASELVALDMGNLLFKSVKVKDESEKLRIFSGAMLRKTQVEGEFEVLSSPVLMENEKVEVVQPGAIVILAAEEVTLLEGKEILIPELSKHIEDVSAIADSFQLENRSGKFYEYDCCFEGKACEKFVKLIPVEDTLKEVLMFSYQKKSVYDKLQVVIDKKEVTVSDSDDEAGGVYEAQGPRTRPVYGKGVEYTNYEDYFMGPKGVDNRTGGDVYRLNVRSGGGSVKDGPCGSYHYNPERFGGLIGGDRYINREALSCFLATLQDFRKEHPTEVVQWGDISRGDRTSFKPDHSTHTDGRSIDVRPVRSDTKRIGCNIKRDPSCLNREMTQAFIDIAMRYGGEPVYFNDKEIIQSSSKIKYAKKHYDHFHIVYSGECADVTLNTKYCPREGFN
jgi:uncharacterized protein YgiM (DUF1202 family)